MRVPAVILAFLMGLVLAPGIAGAEKVKTNQSTKLYNRPGEQAKVLLKVKSGQSMTLLAKDGRWLKVRVNGRTGYVPRSKVDMADDGDIARNTRRRPFVDGRGKKRGESDGAPDDRVGADAMGDNDGGGGDSDEEDDKPTKAATKSKPSKGDDDDEDDKPTKAATKAKPAPKADDDEDEEDEDDKPVAAKSKPAPKAPKVEPKPAAKTDDDEDEDDEEDKPVAAAKAKPAGKSDDDEDEDDDSGKKAAKSEDSRPKARVTKRVSAHSEPDEESDEELVVRPTDTLFVGDTKGDWTYVENSSGDGGWVQNDLLEEGGGAASGGKQIAIRARAGVLAFAQSMRSAASSVQSPPDNYNVKARMLSINLGGGIVFPRGKLLYGGELTYDLAKGSAPYEGFPDTSLTLHNVNVRALIGLDFKKPSGMALLGHVGYRYQGILVADVANPMANPAQLPSEVVKGPAIGAALAIPRLRPKLGLDVSLDAMLFGASITQTKGLEDGASPSAKAIVLGAGISYHLSSLDVLVRYELDYMSVDFGAPLATSTRTHMGTSISRTDLFHGITAGVSKPF